LVRTDSGPDEGQPDPEPDDERPPNHRSAWGQMGVPSVFSGFVAKLPKICFPSSIYDAAVNQRSNSRRTYNVKTSAIASSAYFATSDGVRLHYLEKGLELPLVMPPGWTQPASQSAGQLAVLSATFRCLALDFRGHGNSEQPEHGYRVSRLARDCLGFLDYLDLPDAVLLGHLAGCTVIWSFIDLFAQDRKSCPGLLPAFLAPGWL
jgi:hypothetical protein